MLWHSKQDFVGSSDARRRDRRRWRSDDMPDRGAVTSGAPCKKRGLKPGVPDVLVWYRGKSIAIELKSRRGQCIRSQRLVRDGLLRAGAYWWCVAR